MNENDLRDCFAMFAMLSRRFAPTPMDLKYDAEVCYSIADAMLEARKKEDEEELGIAAVKPKRTYVRKTYNR